MFLIQRVLALFICLLCCDFGVVAEPAQQKSKQIEGPQWIWADAKVGENQEAWFRRSIVIAGKLKSATLEGTCDNNLSVHLNGSPVAASSDWARPLRVDVTKSMVDGLNEIAAWGRNDGGPGGLWLDLTLEFEGGRVRHVWTDGFWNATLTKSDDYAESGFDASDWGLAVVLGEMGMAPWGAQDPQVIEPSRALPGDELELPPGFHAELLYSVPKETQGSWVSLCVDGRGRLIASDQYGALYRIKPNSTYQSGVEVEVERLNVEMGRAHGMVWAFDALYVVVSEGGPRPAGLYRLRDHDRNGTFDEVELLQALKGGGEHGPHAVVLAPDRSALYVIAGNHTALPDNLASSLVPKIWAEDQLLPRLPDANGHANGIMAPGGWICRVDPDGKNWRLIACGMRNAYDFAFDTNGEILTFDSDMEWDIGLPWYRPTRILHLRPGADFGWRHGTGKWPTYYPDSLPGVCDIGLSSPTGVVMGTEADFPDRYKRALFAADWSYGTLYAIHLRPDGGSYVGRAEPFVRGKPFPVTDVVIGHDGAMYITTGGRRTQSGLYRVQWTGETGQGTPVTVNERLDRVPRGVERMGSTQRRLRHSLESLITRKSNDSNANLLAYLGNADRSLRFAARTALEMHAIESWGAEGLQLSSPLGRVNAVIGLARTAPAEWQPRLLAALAEHGIAPQAEELCLEQLRAIGLVCARMGAPDEQQREELLAQLDSLFPCGQVNVDRELAQLLIYLRAPLIVERCLDRIARATFQEVKLHYAFHLRTLREGWTLETRQDYFAFLGGEARGFPGGHSLQRYIDNIVRDARATLEQNVHTQVASWLSRDPRATAAAIPASAPRVKEWRRAELLAIQGRAQSGRDFAQGQAAYKKATCFACHRIANDGGGAGPDLTGAGSRFSAIDFIDSILDPSRVISDQYQDTEIRLKDGEVLVGQVAEEGPDTLVLHVLYPVKESWEISKKEIDIRRPSPTSRMPAGLFDSLNEDEILDLIAYVLSGAQPTDKAFKPQSNGKGAGTSGGR